MEAKFCNLLSKRKKKEKQLQKHIKLRKPIDAFLRRTDMLVVEDKTTKTGRLKLTWVETIRKDMLSTNLTKAMALYQVLWEPRIM